MRWKRWTKHRIIRRLYDNRNWCVAEIKRMGGNRYRILFTLLVDIPPYDVVGQLNTAKAIGIMLVKMSNYSEDDHV